MNNDSLHTISEEALELLDELAEDGHQLLVIVSDWLLVSRQRAEEAGL